MTPDEQAEVTQTISELNAEVIDSRRWTMFWFVASVLLFLALCAVGGKLLLGRG